jgi:hypothetical protein
MKKLASALVIAMSSFPAVAGTYEIFLADIKWEVVDLTPGDGVLPQYTVASGNLQTLLSPVAYRETFGMFEQGTALPPNIGEATVLEGLLYPGTQLQWSAHGQLRLTVIDVQAPYEYDHVVEVRTTFFSAADAGTGHDYLELRTSFGGPETGTYQRLSKTIDFSFEIWASNFQANVPIEYQIGWFNQYQYESFRGTPPIPEPSTYALFAGGLAALALMRRRPAMQHPA